MRSVLLTFLLVPGAAALSESVPRLQSLCVASSLSYLPLPRIATSDYQQLIPNLSPVAQYLCPSTESGATVFSDSSDPDRLVVACRGSATVKNFATNLRFALEPLSFDRKARAHEGFQEAAAGLWEKLAPDVASSGKKLAFTGHSLGGGTAELCALHAAASSAGSGVEEVVTFGAGMLGDAAFVDHVMMQGVPVTHVVHDDDPILHNNRPLWATMGYKRSGKELKCDPHNPRVFAEGSAGDTASSSEKGAGSFSVPPWNILDHCKYLGVFVGPRVYSY